MSVDLLVLLVLMRLCILLGWKFIEMLLSVVMVLKRFEILVTWMRGVVVMRLVSLF